MTALPTVRVLERRTWFAPLGVTFMDAATGHAVTDPLVVTIVSLADERVRVAAVPGPSRVYVLNAFPGLPRDGAAYPQPDASAGARPASRRVRIEVRDPTGRYLPLDVFGDVPTYGLFSPACADLSPPVSPPASADSIPLYPGPGQATSGARAVIRADLRDAGTGGPVAWALASVSYRGTRVGRGVSDASGRLTLVFPFPELATPHILPSPAPATPSTYRDMATWQVSLELASSRAVSQTAVPDLCALHGQAAARALASRSPEVTLTDVSISLGSEAVLRSSGEPHLFLIPGS